MKKLPVCNKLINSKKKIRTSDYCVPIFIASTSFGTLIVDDDNLAPEKFDENSIRSGTLTFISYKGEKFAITCKHVVDALEVRRKKWKKDDKVDVEGFQFFTPIGVNQYHFNYKLTPVPINKDGVQPDIAIARVNNESIKRLNRKAINLTSKNKLPPTGIASGYPEFQRKITEGKNINKFSSKFVTCIATLQETSNGGILVEDSIENHKDLDNLSGMSGGPIIWSDSNRFGIIGIVSWGADIQPKPNELRIEDGILIHGLKISTEIFESWLNHIPELTELKDETKSLYIPPSMGE